MVDLEVFYWGNRMAERFYHYTTPQAFFSIIQSKHLWMRDVRQMNDHRELHVGREFISDALADDRFGYEFVERMSEHSAEHEYYVSCFSENGDQLSQWRGYAGDGTGVCLGFEVDRESLSEIFQFREVVYYDKGAADSRVGSLMQNLARRYGPIINQMVRSDILERPEVENDFIRMLAEIKGELASYKGVGFKEEKEWRIIYSPTSRMYRLNSQGPFFVDQMYQLEFEFAVLGSMLCKCFRLPLCGELAFMRLVEVRKGPKCTFIPEDIAELVRISGLNDDVEITDSKISYR